MTKTTVLCDKCGREIKYNQYLYRVKIDCDHSTTNFPVERDLCSDCNFELLKWLKVFDVDGLTR